jgi:hypothetical protein
LVNCDIRPPGLTISSSVRAPATSSSIESAARHGVPTHCIWLDTPLDQAQFNLVRRILDRSGSLPSPEELRALARREPRLLMPTSRMRALRELEAPTSDE